MGSKAAPKPPAKKQKADPALKQCAEAAKGLRESDLPQDTIRMLSEMLSPALATYKEQRHPFQARIVAMVGDTLAATEVGMKESGEETSKFIADGEEAKVSRLAELVKALEEATAKQEATEQEKRALATSAKAYKAAKEAVEDARESMKAHAQKLKGVSENKDQLRVADSAYVKPLMEGVEDKVAHIEALCEVLKEFGFDVSILVALPNAFAKAPSERGSFDLMVITNLNEEIGKRIASFEATLREADADAAKAQAAIAEAETAFKVAQEKQLASADLFTECRGAQDTAEAQAEESRAAVKEVDKQLAQLIREQAKGEKRLGAFHAGPLAAFLGLRDQEAPPPEPEEAPEEPPAAEEEVPAEDGAEDAAMEVAA
eukprot:CAMPEP_0183433336 /NCGR_PEP_ID=MMETSP0370-20130417/61326_1 /TAXON_ID=268820 /ORGANISM="Peridinium aciculiferum, Strain PAER-2" /LENGTH=373 /DNA_ID=CAMNT_0025619647 /DNA_START=100 /DNA_END=1221 /DNA_ORIENTATION=-